MSEQRRAVVIGASIAGLCTARVLADRFGHVVVVDRGDLPAGPEFRSVVPQGRHAHGILESGQRALEQLFPGVTAELVAAGGPRLDHLADCRVVQYGHPLREAVSGCHFLTVTRPLLEWSLRRRVLDLPNVTIRPDCAAIGLSGDTHRVTGVRTADGELLAADLVADCSGSAGRSDRWLADLGVPRPEVSQVKIGAGYSSRLLKRLPGERVGGAEAAYVLASPPGSPQGGNALPVEGDRWLIGLFALHVGGLPDDDSSFLAFARSLPDPSIAELVARAEPVSGIFLHRFPASRRRHFERLTDVPAGLVTVGDALCTFNPVYGQGMTSAAFQALALEGALDRFGPDGAGTAAAYYTAAAKAVEVPWTLAAGGDFAFPQTRGPKPRGTDLVNHYVRRVAMAAQVSPSVARTLTSVVHLTKPPTHLFHPSTAVRVAAAALRSRR
ncbi:NAD(P)/FAD-dependent oxidoreductase [Streptomyces sp. NBC_00878]|uniref:FAD-dependent oxidoreductase n=1 Tax=Streptomyces sp. NBC_00878 TaxID=2975854 RepID=UPI00224F799C|nr:monooxygenase [Streptomyces sp. NBC_00878]MCX4904389.1 monooxygenase [Streptomyces sp. NBC_00878]